MEVHAAYQENLEEVHAVVVHEMVHAALAAYHEIVVVHGGPVVAYAVDHVHLDVVLVATVVVAAVVRVDPVYAVEHYKGCVEKVEEQGFAKVVPLGLVLAVVA